MNDEEHLQQWLQVNAGRTHSYRHVLKEAIFLVDVFLVCVTTPVECRRMRLMPSNSIVHAFVILPAVFPPKSAVSNYLIFVACLDLDSRPLHPLAVFTVSQDVAERMFQHDPSFPLDVLYHQLKRNQKRKRCPGTTHAQSEEAEARCSMSCACSKEEAERG